MTASQASPNIMSVHAPSRAAYLLGILEHQKLAKRSPECFAPCASSVLDSMLLSLHIFYDYALRLDDIAGLITDAHLL